MGEVLRSSRPFVTSARLAIAPRTIDEMRALRDVEQDPEMRQAYSEMVAAMTSQPSQLEYDQAFQAAYDSGIPTVLFCISSGISGGYNGAVTALDRFKEEHSDEEVRIYVVDCLLASTAQTLLVEEACHQRDAGRNAEEIVLWANEARYHVHTVFLVDNLDALHRGGRLPKAISVVGDALDVKAILHFSLDGSLGIRSVARGRKKGMALSHVRLTRKEFISASLAFVATATLAACSGADTNVATSDVATSTDDSSSSTPSGDVYSSGVHHATIDVASFGTISVALNATAAPITVSNFAGLVNKGFYDGLTFHRVISGFMSVVDAICASVPVEDSNGTVAPENQPVISSIVMVD